MEQYSQSSEEWFKSASCSREDPEMFFPQRAKSKAEADAMQVCRECPVRQECLDYALEHEERFGVWGGVSERERKAMLRRRSREQGIGRQIIAHSSR